MVRPFQTAIAELIRIADLPQREIAANAGVKQEQLSDWKTGRRAISLDNFVKLCEGNGIAPSKVLEVLDLT